MKRERMRIRLDKLLLRTGDSMYPKIEKKMEKMNTKIEAARLARTSKNPKQMVKLYKTALRINKNARGSGQEIALMAIEAAKAAHTAGDKRAAVVFTKEANKQFQIMLLEEQGESPGLVSDVGRRLKDLKKRLNIK